MRHPLIGAGLALALAASAHAGDDPGDIDLVPHRDQLQVLGDGAGHYLVLVPFASGEEPIFFGDDRVLHRQRVLSAGGARADGNFSHRVWSPTSPSHADIEVRGGSAWTVRCGERATSFEALGDAEASALLERARFRPEAWQRSAYLLARDDRGRYVYVDRLLGRRYGFRLFAGKRGAMKPQRLTDVVSDSEGDLFIGRGGTLRVDGGRFAADRTATWIRGAVRRSLRVLPLADSRVLIHRELGLYRGEKLGTPCEVL